MNCKRYREKLSDVLGSSETALSAEIVAHLRNCVACREFYEAQTHLFAAMDAGVRAMANEAVPASLLAGVRAKMGETRIAQPWPIWLVPAAGVVIAVLLSLIPIFPRHSSQMPGEVSAEATKVAAAVGSGAASAEPVPHGTPSVHPAGAQAPGKASRHKARPLEVIVLPAERAAFARIASVDPQMVEELIAEESAKVELAERAEVAPVKIDEIKVPPIELVSDK